MAQSKPVAQGAGITERKQTEKALSREKNFSDAVINSLPGLLFVFDDKGNTMQWNRNVEKVTGYSAKEISKMNILDFVAKEDQKTAVEAVQEVLTKGQASLEINVLSKPGKKTPFYIKGLRTKFENITCVVCTGIDITERKQAEHQARERMKELRAFYSLAEITEREGISLDELYQEFANILPQSWQYPEIACARIVIGDSEFCTENFTESPWKQSAPVRVHASVVGRIEVGYLEERPEEDVGPFLKEERQLIDVIAERLGRVTERKQAEEKLLESEKRYRTIIESIEDGYFEVDLAGTFTYVNDAQCRMTGSSRERLIGRNNREYTSEEEAKKLYQFFSGIYKTGEPVTGFAFEYKRKDGNMAYNEMSVSLIRDTEGKPIGFRGISRDVTERKKAEERLRHYAAELERSNEEVKNFAYIVSHDLRVPLVNLKGYTSELRTALEVIGSNFDAALPHLNDEKRSAVATALHEDVPEALEFITSSVSRMDGFINAVLILSRLGRQELKPEPIDMNALVQTTVETMSHLLQERGITVIVESLPQVVADRTAMEQIMGNILSNAVKYLDSSRPGRIEVKAQANGAETAFRIRDNGRGIAQEDMDKVFAPFRRAGKQDTPGEGMGLAYVQTLLRRHGGRISCESEPGKGTTFIFTIANPSGKGAQDA